MSGFHEVRLPLRLAFGSGAGIERKTQITTMGSGFERRINPWAMGRRHYLISAGVKSLNDAAELLHFFEAREGQLIGFRFKDFADYKSCPLAHTPSANDQIIGAGNAIQKLFALKKAYGQIIRPITKPVVGSLKIAFDGVEITQGFSLDSTNGTVIFNTAPSQGVVITAGFEFDTPVRFNTDRIDLTLESFNAGRVAAVELIEIKV